MSKNGQFSLLQDRPWPSSLAHPRTEALSHPSIGALGTSYPTEEGSTCAGPSGLRVPAQIAKANGMAGISEDLPPLTVPKCFGLGFSYGGD